jgi:hypothetical protein
MGLSITWMDAKEANEKCFAENNALSLDDFSQSIIAEINGKIFQPLALIIKSLSYKTPNKNSFLYIKFSAQQLKDSLDINDWSYICVEKLRRHEMVFGGNYYHEALKEIDFDDSLASIQKIDALLMVIAHQEAFDEEGFEKYFLAIPEKKNFLILIAFYLVVVIAKKIHPFFRWCDYEMLVQITENENLENDFYNHLCLHINGDIIKPLTLLKGALVQESQQGLVLFRFVDFVTEKYKLSLLEQVSSTVQEKVIDISLPELWKKAASLAGYLAGMGALYLHDGGHLPTTLLPIVINADGEVDRLTINNLSFIEDSVRHGLTLLEENPKSHPIQLLMYDVYLNLPSRRTDAICIDIRVYSHEQPLQLKFNIPYHKKTDVTPFRLEPLVVNKHYYVMTHKYQEEAKALLAALFYKEAFKFESEITGPLWQRFFEDIVVDTVDTQLLTTEELSVFYKKIEVLLYGNELKANPFIDIDIMSHISELPLKYRPYLQIVPDWLTEKDELYRQIIAMPSLYKKGKVVWGVLIQANKMMFDSNETANCPGEVLFDPTGQTDIQTLRELAHKLFLLKNTTPTELDQLQYAQHITNELTRIFNMLYPQSIATLPLRVSSIWFWRLHLPNGALSLGYFPVLVCEEGDGEVMVLPSYFWPLKFKKTWIESAIEANGSFVDLEKSVFAGLDRGDFFSQRDLQPPLSLLFEKQQQASKERIDQTTTLSDIAKNTQHAQALFEEGLAILNAKKSLSQQDVTKALSLLQDASQRGNTEAMMTLFRMYYDGYAVPQDRERAFKLALNAAERGNGTGCFAVYGYLYHPDNSDNSEAIKWLVKASQLGITTADGILKDVLQQEAQKVADKAKAKFRPKLKMSNTITVILVLIMLWLLFR